MNGSTFVALVSAVAILIVLWPKFMATLKFTPNLLITETVDQNTDFVADQVLNHNVPAFQSEGALNLSSSSTPDVEYVHTKRYQLTAGALTIDLAALTGPAGTTVNMTGKALRFIALAAKSTNTSPVVIVGGASEGILLFGTSGSVALAAGQKAYVDYGTGGASIVNNTTDKIDVSSVDADAYLDVVIAAG